jgi:hypothetical protein
MPNGWKPKPAQADVTAAAIPPYRAVPDAATVVGAPPKRKKAKRRAPSVDVAGRPRRRDVVYDKQGYEIDPESMLSRDPRTGLAFDITQKGKVW